MTETFLISVLYTGAVHPPRRVLVYLVILVGAVAAPLLDLLEAKARASSPG